MERMMRAQWNTPRIALIAVIGATSCALAFAAGASGNGTVAALPLASEALQLEPVASTIAGRPLSVLCYRHGELGDPLLWAVGDTSI
jgi:hypothetical protein